MDAPLYNDLPGQSAIRLLKLETGCGEEPIVVSLITVDSVSALEYDALSYVWGDPNATEKIICNNILISITINLHWALLRIRKSDKATVVWADALCIDQENVQERSHQISMMGAIYSNACIVYLCMGKDPDGRAADAYSVLEDMSPYVSGGIISNHPDLKKFEKDNRWFAISVLIHQPWFFRAWVVQEAGLAENPRACYGNVEFCYRHLLMVVTWLNRHKWSIRYNLTARLIHMLWSDWRQPPSQPNLTFLDLMRHCSWQECSDLRDHVYSYLGHTLAQHADGSGLIVQPDYSKEPSAVYA